MNIMVYVFLADGFEECEAVAPIDMLRRADIEVTTVKIQNGSKTNDEMALGSHDIAIEADIHESDTDLEKISMIVLPGGAVGVENLYNSPIIKNAVDYCVKNNLPIGAICAAPSILARWGYLKDKKATAHPLFKHYLTENGATLSDMRVVTDGIFTTAEAAGVSIDFSLELVTVMKGKDISEKIAKQIVK